MVNHCFTQKQARSDTFVPYVCTIPQHQKKVRPKTSQRLLANITKIFGYAKRLTGIFHNHGYYIYSQKRNRNQAQKEIFSISVITEKLHQLHWACRNFGNLSKSL